MKGGSRMGKKPAWQQVVLHVLRNVPEAKNGHDAWEKLKEEEKSAVMGFLAEHGDMEAHTALEETCARIKRPQWLNVTGAVLIAVAAMAASVTLVLWMRNHAGVDLKPWFLMLFIVLHLRNAWQGNPANKALQVLHSYMENRENLPGTLEKMYHVYTMPRKERMDKVFFAIYLVLLVLLALAAAADLWT